MITKCKMAFFGVEDGKSVYDITELLDTLEKNGFRRDSYEIVRPNKVGQGDSVVAPGFPKTLREFDSLLSSIDRTHLGKLVGQSLVEGSVSFAQSQTLVSHLAMLAQASDRLRQVIKPILEKQQNRAAVAEAW